MNRWSRRRKPVHKHHAAEKRTPLYKDPMVQIAIGLIIVYAIRYVFGYFLPTAHKDLSPSANNPRGLILVVSARESPSPDAFSRGPEGVPALSGPSADEELSGGV